jgi:hypothetical protein
MEETCRRATELGLPAVAFTEHADFTAWVLEPGDEVPGHWRDLVAGGFSFFSFDLARHRVLGPRSPPALAMNCHTFAASCPHASPCREPPPYHLAPGLP